MRIALDAMGGDYAPKNTVEGAVLALKAYPRIPEELEFEPGQYRVGDCFSGFEDHVAGEPVADHHFSRFFKQVVSFDVTAKIEPARF